MRVAQLGSLPDAMEHLEELLKDEEGQDEPDDEEEDDEDEDEDDEQ